MIKLITRMWFRRKTILDRPISRLIEITNENKSSYDKNNEKKVET